ncbi:MAG TPA: erythromycin esterase family protein, partial [Pirellulales bacterium]|nr:erythromycin esterase family protein [Pirellulales bacterium]
MICRTSFTALFYFAISVTPAMAEPPTDADVEWIKEHTVPIMTAAAESGFDDLLPLKDAIGDARIVSLGESTHGSREIFQMKHRLLEFLAAEMGFTIFSIEANMPESYRLNDYALHGKGDANRLIAGMYFWTWNTREVKDMVEWMRRFNQSGKGRVEFTGFDMQTPDVAVEEVLRFLEKADRKQHAAAQAAYRRAAKATRVAAAEFGAATGSFPVEAARGKKVTFRGWIKTQDVRAFAGLWWRADGPQQTLAFDNMQSQEIDGTRDWRQYKIELNVPPETTNINFGVLMPGKGTAWFDGLEVLLDEEPFEAPDGFDLDFEGDTVRGLIVFPQSTYRTELDSEVAKTGKQSLRLRSIDDSGATSAEEFESIKSACEEVFRQLADAREELVKDHAAQEVEWAIVNARLVLSAMRQRGGDMTVRDAAMADNVEWILRQNPGAKIVLWAHNGHVGKQPSAMGHYLDQKFGAQHVAIAFATTSGEYRAIGKQGLGNHLLQTPPAESYEATFERTGLDRFFLDPRQVKTDAEGARWLAEA